MKVHKESLLQIPLVRIAIDDSKLVRVARSVDQKWKYENFIPISVAGFNPFEAATYYAEKSCLASWLKKPEQSARNFNLYDRLVHESLFMAHDYLHAWAVSAIRDLAKESIHYGSDPIDQANLESYVFCHLLTEAVATVGLDYWYLSQIHLNEVCPIGSRVRCLTIGYHKDYEREIRNFNPNLNVNSKEFFKFIAEFYCSGIFTGFSIEDLERSPILLGWLDHEVTYAEKQREYARRWFTFLSKENPKQTLAQLNGPVTIKKEWQRRLISNLGEALWEKMKNPNSCLFPIKPLDNSLLWKYADRREPDPRFMNLRHFEPDDFRVPNLDGSQEKFSFLAYQFISQFDFEKIDPAVLKFIPEIFEKRSVKFMRSIFAKQRKIPARKIEPKHLLMLN